MFFVFWLFWNYVATSCCHEILYAILVRTPFQGKWWLLPPRSIKLFLFQPLASPALSFKIQNFSKSSLSKPVVYHTLAFKAFGFSKSSLGKSSKCFSNSFWAALTCQPATSTNWKSIARTGALSKICFSTKRILAKSLFNHNLNAQNHCFWCVAFWNGLWTAVPQITGQPYAGSDGVLHNAWG